MVEPERFIERIAALFPLSLGFAPRLHRGPPGEGLGKLPTPNNGEVDGLVRAILPTPHSNKAAT